MAPDLDVIIIGGGLSGLSAAYRLKNTNRNLKIVVLEAKFRVGGRTLSSRMRCANHKTDVWDLGGQWVCCTQTYILSLLGELGLSTYPQYLEGKKLLQLSNNKIRSYNKSIPQISLWAALDLFRFIKKVEALANEINVCDPYSHPRAAELDGMTFETYKNQHLKCQESRQLIDIAFRTTFGYDSCNMSCLYALMYGSAAGGILRLFEATEGAAQQLRVKVRIFNLAQPLIGDKKVQIPAFCQLCCTLTVYGTDCARVSALFPHLVSKSADDVCSLFFPVMHCGPKEFNIKGGTQQICFQLMDKLGPDLVLLNHPVTEIIQRDNTVNVMTANGKCFHGAKVIIAIPTHETLKIQFSPSLPEPRRILFQNMPMGHLTKFVCTYEMAFWREKNFSGEIVTNGGCPLVADCDSGPLGIVYDGTTDSGNPALVGFISGHNGIQWSTKTPTERKAAVLQNLAFFFGEETLKPIDYAEKVWAEEPYTGGCPVNVMVPGVMKYINKHFRAPFGRIHWAGTETATAWCGYMDGAVQAGNRAAKEVLHDLNPGSVSEKELADTVYAEQDAKKICANRRGNFVRYAELAVGVTVLASVIIAAQKRYNFI